MQKFTEMISTSEKTDPQIVLTNLGHAMIRDCKDVAEAQGQLNKLKMFLENGPVLTPVSKAEESAYRILAERMVNLKKWPESFLDQLQPVQIGTGEVQLGE